MVVFQSHGSLAQSFPFYQHVTFITVLLLVHVKKNSPLSSNIFIVIEATVVL